MKKKTSKTAPSPWLFVTQPEEDRAMDMGSMLRNLVKIARVVLEIFSRTERQTDRHTGVLITIPSGISWRRNWHRRWCVVWSCPGSTIAMLCCTALKLQHQEITPCAEERSSDRSPQVPKRWSHARPLLRMLHWLPVWQMIEYKLSGSADVQSLQHVHAGVPSSR